LHPALSHVLFVVWVGFLSFRKTVFRAVSISICISPVLDVWVSWYLYVQSLHLTIVVVVTMTGTGWLVWLNPSSMLEVVVSLLVQSWSSFSKYCCRLLYLSMMLEFPHVHLRIMCLMGAINWFLS
jgi:hypothetical protein